MNILVIPDSFKGSMTSKEVCETIKNVIEANSNHHVEAIPFADGGEGFGDCMAELCGGQKLYTKCHNIYGQETDGYIVAFENTAVVECATASGLLKRKNVMQSTSFGTGELIKFAFEQGYSNIILGLGGTGCNDGGMGVLTALGGRFFDENFNVIKMPKSNDMNFVFGVNFKSIAKGISFTYACDVTNEYYGENGAAFVFAKQKGARQTDIEELDEGLKRLNAFFSTDLGKVKGTGAAGGICGGLYAVYGGDIRSGFEILAHYADLESKIKNADIIITGEGKTDSQTLNGKLPQKICELCKKYGKKSVVISGSVEDVSIGDNMISLVDNQTSLEQALAQPQQVLAKKVEKSLEIILK